MNADVGDQGVMTIIQAKLELLNLIGIIRQ